MSIGVKRRLPLTGPRQILVEDAAGRVSEDIEEYRREKYRRAQELGCTIIT